MARMLRSLALPLAAALALTPLAPARAFEDGDDGADARWDAWEADVEYLLEEIGKPASLQQILKVKGIEWKKVSKEADKRFKALAKAARKRARDDEEADRLAYYGYLRWVIGQLRDGHAYVEVEESLYEAWAAQQPKLHSTGVELLPGAYGTVVVAYVNQGDPISGRGIRDDATLLESVNGTPAAEYFARRGQELLEQGGLSTLGRAEMLAMHRLEMAEDEELELVFQVLDASEKERKKYLELSEKKKAKAFKRLKWKEKKFKLRYRECERARNPWTFRCRSAPLPKLTKTSDEDVWFGKLESGMGIIVYDGVSRGANEGLRQACRELADCPGLILDVRRNGGGGDGGAEEVFDAKEGAWSKPFAVVMGPWCMSAGETEVWSLGRARSRKRCNFKSFGTATAGASGDKIRWELPSGFAQGRFVYKHWHNEQSTIEGAGVEPDVVVHQDLVELSFGTDSLVRAAEDWLRTECGLD